MTTNVYWAEVVQETNPTEVYWAEIEQTSAVGEAVSGSGELPEVTTVTLVGGDTIAAGATLDLTVTVEDQDGDPVENFEGTPASTDTGVATVAWLSATDASGEATVRATGVAGGSTQVTVTADSQRSPLQVVDVVAVTTVNLSIPATTLEVGTTGIATATALDQDGDPVSGATITFASTTDATIADPASGTTGGDGRVSVPLPALAAGTTTITASCEGVDSAGIVVTVTAGASAPGYSATGSARVVINCVSVVKRMGRSQPRRFSDADQRKLDPTDTAFSRVKDNQEKQIVWPSRELMKRYL